jgi:hypothetical protein
VFPVPAGEPLEPAIDLAIAAARAVLAPGTVFEVTYSLPGAPPYPWVPPGQSVSWRASLAGQSDRVFGRLDQPIPYRGRGYALVARLEA